MQLLLNRFFSQAQIRQVVRFGVSGVIATAIHLSVYMLLLTTEWIAPALASGVGFLVAFSVSFMLQKFWTFANHATTHAPKQLIQFFFLQCAMLVFNMTGVYFLVEVHEVAPLLGQVLILGVAATVTFTTSKFLIFTSDAAVSTDKTTYE